MHGNFHGCIKYFPGRFSISRYDTGLVLFLHPFSCRCFVSVQSFGPSFSFLFCYYYGYLSCETEFPRWQPEIGGRVFTVQRKLGHGWRIPLTVRVYLGQTGHLQTFDGFQPSNLLG